MCRIKYVLGSTAQRIHTGLLILWEATPLAILDDSPLFLGVDEFMCLEICVRLLNQTRSGRMYTSVNPGRLFVF